MGKEIPGERKAERNPPVKTTQTYSEKEMAKQENGQGKWKREVELEGEKSEIVRERGRKKSA